MNIMVTKQMKLKIFLTYIEDCKNSFKQPFETIILYHRNNITEVAAGY